MVDEITPETLTDAQADDFFENEGKFKEPEKVAEPKPELEKDTADEVKEQPKEEKKVNLGALHEERAKRKQEKELREAAERERDDLRAQLQRKPQEEQQDEDPIEALRKENEQIKQFLGAQASHAIKTNEEQQYWGKIKQDEITFKADKPDFDDAIKFLANSRMEELKDLGWNDAEAQKVLSDEIKWIADKAYVDEVNPAERFYNLAGRRGFKKQSVEGKSVPTAAETKLDNIKKGMETNKQLPPSSKSVKQDLTAESLADMNIDALTNIHGQTEFDKAWNKLFGTR